MRQLILTCIICVVLVSCGSFNQVEFLKEMGEQPATFSINPITKNPDTLYMNGVIFENTPDDLKNALAKYPKIKVICMQEVPGSIDDENNLIAAKMVYDKKLNTCLKASSSVASGGTDFFLAGRERTVENGAKIGVHSWAEGENGREGISYPEDHKKHMPYISFYESIGMKNAKEFYWFTLKSAPAEDIHWMTRDEMKQYAIID